MNQNPVNLLSRSMPSQLRRLSTSNPFIDQAATHTFSDWLMAFSFDFGHEPDGDFEMGALPDLRPAILRKSGVAEVDSVTLKSRRLLPLGNLLKEEIKGKYFIDLACGNPKTSVAPLMLAEFFKARAYIGVDLYHSKTSMDLEGFEKHYFQLDILEFLARLEFKGPKIFFFGGVDPKDDGCFEYLEAVRKELMRLCEPGDLVILGAGSTGLGLEKEGKAFKAIYTDFFHEVAKRSA